MTDIVLVPVTGGSNLSAINSNFDKIEEAINTDVLHLKGGNNVMKQDLDLNGHQLLNHETDLNDPDSLINVGDADARYYNVSGDALAGNMNAAGNKILNLPQANAPHEPMRKNEVDATNAAQDAVTAANNSKTIRTPEAIPALGNAASRADKLLSFDSSGNPVAIAAANQSATDLELRLANFVDPEKGAGLVGWVRDTLSESITTVSEYLNSTKVSAWEFASLATGYAPGGDPLTWNWTPAIAAAIATGKDVFLPPSVYTVDTNSLTLSTNGQSISGVGSNSVLKTAGTTGTILILSGADAAALNIKVEGPGASSGSVAGIIATGSRNKISGCQAVALSNAGLGTDVTSTKAIINNNVCYLNKSGISVFGSKYTTVTSNHCSQNGVSGLGGGILLFGTGGGTSADGAIISGNNCSENMATGISINGATRSAITGNTCNANGINTGDASGIVALLEGAAVLQNLAITGNHCSQNTDHGIVVQNNKDHTSVITGIAVTGNTCDTNRKVGIRFINGIDGGTITGNSCNGNGTSGSSTDYRHGIMIADRCTRNIVSGNTCFNNAEDGIRITDLTVDFVNAGSGENTIIGNNCRANAGYGINLNTATVASTANRLLSNFTRGNTTGEINNTHTNTDKSGNRRTFDRLDGTTTLVAGTATANTTEIQTGDRVSLSVVTPGGAQGAHFISAIVNATSFTITSTSATDTSTIAWRIEH